MEQQFQKPGSTGRQQQARYIRGEGKRERSEVPGVLTTLGLGETEAYLEAHPGEARTALQDHDWSVRAAAVQVLGKQGERAPLDLFVRAMHDEHPSVRAMAARALGMQGKRAPVEGLVEALQDPEWRVRAAAALALGRLGKRTPVEALVDTVKDEHAAVRAAVVWALGRMEERAPIAVLETALHDKDWSVREAAVMAMQEQAERASMAPLLAARWDEDSSVREAAEAALDQHLYGEQHGQKLGAEGVSRPASSWLRLAISLVSVVSLVPLAQNLFDTDFMGRFALIAQLVAMGAFCVTICVINLIYQRKRFNISFERKSRGSRFLAAGAAWHGMILVTVSMITLVSLVSPLFLTTMFASMPQMTADIFHFILICRLVALGFITLTIVVINKIFHSK